MTLLILIFIASLAWFLKVLILEKPEREPPKSVTFKVAVKYGELQCVVQYESTPNPIEPSVERIIRIE
jgi:hypothetical protein